ncbi:MAG: hypothetical protein ACRDT2_07615 [Natronosporangium sp.]
MLIVRSLRALALVVAVVVVPGIIGSAAPAALAQAEPECVRETGVIVGEAANGDPEVGAGVVDVCETAGGGSGGDGERTCQAPGLGTIPCVDPAMGWWSSSVECYVHLLDPQPPAGDPLWEGHDTDEGAVYEFNCWEGDPGAWFPSSGFRAEEPEQPSVAELAQQAIDSIPLPGPHVGIAPDPSGAGLVGLPVWLWTENVEATWGPVPGQATIPGVITVTARAEAARITWDMGDGNTVACDDPGTPYQARFGSEPSPTCGHVYSVASAGQPDGRFAITATTDWRVEWWVEPRGSGAESADDIGFVRDSTTSVRINELQVVTS